MQLTCMHDQAPSPKESTSTLWYQYVTPPPPRFIQAIVHTGKHATRDATRRYSNSLVTLRKWNRRNTSTKPIYINNNTHRRHVSHSNILSLSPTNVLSLLTPVGSHAIGMTVYKTRIHSHKPMCQHTWTPFNTLVPMSSRFEPFF